MMKAWLSQIQAAAKANDAEHQAQRDEKARAEAEAVVTKQRIALSAEKLGHS